MKLIFPILLIVGITLGAGFWLGQRNSQATSQTIATVSTRQVYVCPMHSHIVQDHSGSCPICGMDLVQSGLSEAGAQIYVDTSTQQKFGVRLASAERGSLAHEIHTYATITTDANAMQRITPTVDGLLVKLHAARPGQRIHAGEPLYEIFSQELLQLQNEYVDYFKRRGLALKSADETRLRNREMLESLHGQEVGGREQVDTGMRQSEEQINTMLIPMSRDGERLTARLKFAGFSAAMLQQLADKRKAWETVTIPAQRTCTVSEVSARVGMAVSAMTEILSCAEANRGWLEVVFYPDQATYIHEGEVLKVTFADGSQIQTKLTGLSNITDASTRTIKARIPIKFTAGQQLGDYADVTLLSAPREVLTIPVSAVIRSGHGNYVMRALGDGHFMPQQIITGIANDEHIGIIEGLEAGDKVAINGQFLLDAAASIADAAQRYKQNK